MTFDNPILVPPANDACPKCGDSQLGQMRTMRLQFCTCCSIWLKTILGDTKLMREKE